MKINFLDKEMNSRRWVSFWLIIFHFDQRKFFEMDIIVNSLVLEFHILLNYKFIRHQFH